jgi:hypothetical protein
LDNGEQIAVITFATSTNCFSITNHAINDNFSDKRKRTLALANATVQQTEETSV